MPFNLLLFPLAGGYFLLVRSQYFKYYHQRIERQKLIFNSVIAGILLLIAAFVITSVCYWVAPDFCQTISKKSPVSLPFFWTTLGSFILGVLLTEGPNRFIDHRNKSIIAAIQSIGNELELLLEASNSSGELVMLSLDNNKVYVGWVKALPIPNRSDYVKIFPIYSGYRDKETHEVKFTTQYLDIYASYIQQGVVSSFDIRTLTSTIIKVGEIVTASNFDQEMYDRFNYSKPGQASTDPLGI